MAITKTDYEKHLKDLNDWLDEMQDYVENLPEGNVEEAVGSNPPPPPPPPPGH